MLSCWFKDFVTDVYIKQQGYRGGQGAGDRVVKGWGHLVYSSTENVISKMVDCGTAVIWRDGL